MKNLWHKVKEPIFWIIFTLVLGLSLKEAVAGCTGSWVKPNEIYKVVVTNINATGATDICNLPGVFDRGYAKYTKAGTGVVNMTIQMGDGASYLSTTLFTNSTTTLAINNSNTDTRKQDFVYRGGTAFRFFCESGCEIANNVTIAEAILWRVGR